MDALYTLDRFFDLCSKEPVPDGNELSAAFARLKPSGCPDFPRSDGAGAFAAIEHLAREATDAVDQTSSRASPSKDVGAFAELLVAASIAAAKADQRFNEEDLKAIASLLEAEAGRDSSIRMVREEILRPMMIEHMTRRRWTRAETVELYTASRLAINASDELSEHYLKMLAARLGLEQALTDQIEVVIARRK
jgi:uncharacterized membrane protein YebE (DUF533 family)